jgi:hypothetical protein
MWLGMYKPIFSSILVCIIIVVRCVCSSEDKIFPTQGMKSTSKANATNSKVSELLCLFADRLIDFLFAVLKGIRCVLLGPCIEPNIAFYRH